MAKPASRTRKLRTSAKPPNTRGRTPIQDIIRDSFIGFPKLSRSGPDGCEQILAEALLEFTFERLDRIDEGLPIDLLDDVHSAAAQLFEPRGVELRLPGCLSPRPGGRDQLRLVARIELFEHRAVCDEGDRRKEMAGERDVFLNFVEPAGGDGRHRIFLAV